MSPSISALGVKNGDEVIGNETRVKVVKNKVAPPFKQAEFQIVYNEGINLAAELIDLGVKLGMVDKAGAWYAYNGDKIGQGKANACKFLLENPAVFKEIEDLIRNELLVKPVEEAKAKAALKAAAKAGESTPAETKKEASEA